MSDKGIQTSPSKVEKIVNWPQPKNHKELHSFLGLCNYYRNFVCGYAKLVKPLECHLNKTKDKNTKWFWEEEQSKVFDRLKFELTSTNVLAYPNAKDMFILDTDASHDCTGAVLSQIQNGKEMVIEYASHTMTKQEKSYCITRKELLAVHRYVLKFKHYLLGRRFIIRTDHKSLIWLLNWRKPNTSQYCSWLADLQLYEFDIQHRKGEHHVNADSLSRYPSCEQCELNHSDPKKKRNVKLLKDDGEIIAMFENNNIQDVDINNKNHIIKHCHTTLGHAGIEKCYQKLRLIYQWNGMKEDIVKYVKSCAICQRFKPDHTKKTIESNILVGENFETISIDITGPLPSVDGYTHILGIIDHKSRYPMYIPLKSVSSNIIIRELSENWISNFGCPIVVHSDNAPIFKSEQFDKFCKRHNMIQTFSPPYSPKSNGIIERSFKTLKSILKCLHQEEGTKWKYGLWHAEMVMRNTINRISGKTPSELVFRHIVNDLYSCQFNRRKDIIMESLNKRENQLKPKKDFKINDLVWMKTHSTNRDGLYDGPYKVIDRFGDKVYRLKDEGNRIITRHADDIKQYHKPMLPTKTVSTSIWSRKGTNYKQNGKKIDELCTNNEMDNQGIDKVTRKRISQGRETGRRRYPTRSRKEVKRFAFSDN